MKLAQNEPVAPSCCVTCKSACAALYACHGGFNIENVGTPENSHGISTCHFHYDVMIL